MTERFDLASLGDGPVGYVAALRAARLGARAALIEGGRVGGTCLNIGCIPTTALITSTELLLEARRAREFGVASVGLTEAQARGRSADVKVTQFPFSANPRARILGETDGLVKLVCEAGSGVVLGVHLMGPHVTDLIAAGALAIQVGATADDLAWTTHAHPTLPEAMLEAALGFRDATIHFQRR